MPDIFLYQFASIRLLVPKMPALPGRCRATSLVLRLTSQQAISREGVALVALANLDAAWLAVLLGILGGIAQGLFFHEESWLGGYVSWRRRCLRLGHLSLFALAFLNILFVFSASYLNLKDRDLVWSSRLFIAGLFSMPLVCYLSAAKKGFRHLFFIPVCSLLAATLFFFAKAVFR